MRMYAAALQPALLWYVLSCEMPDAEVHAGDSRLLRCLFAVGSPPSLYLKEQMNNKIGVMYHVLP